MNQNLEADTFPLPEARAMVKDLVTPNPMIYWADFLASVTLGWSAFYFALKLPLFAPVQILAYLIATFALYRAVIFTHELTHLKKGTFKFFRLIWNVACGFPLLVPSFTYHGVHNDHHTRDIYGTSRDGEYIPFVSKKPFHIITYVLVSFILPPFFALRFLVLAPLGWLNKSLSNFIWQRASSLTIDLGYHRPSPSKRDDPTWRLQEFFTFVLGWTVIGLAIFGFIPLAAFGLWYAVAFLIFFLNSLRTLAAHAYRNSSNQTMSVAEQYLDSVDVPGRDFLTPLWAPVGLRYHATHHLFPKMPYHALGTAHRRLATGLPNKKLYLKASRKSLFHALRVLWGEAGAGVISS
ncbi:MAG: fatty acid desaturase family protein [Alphaproteobacteria bacterium]